MREGKLLAMLFLFAVLSVEVLGQATDSTAAVDEDPVFVVVEQRAEFPGGQTRLMEFLRKQVQIPKDAPDKIKGYVFVEFIIGRDGVIDKESIKVIKGVYPSLDEEAIRLVKLMPNWIPAEQNHKAVKSKFVLPFNFASH